MPTVEFRNVSKYFGSIKALHRVNLKVADGEYVVLLGPSGCGKTTLLKCLGGIFTPDGGRLFVSGRDVTQTPPEERGVGFVFQNYALFPHMSALENAAYGLLAHGEIPDRARRLAHEALALVHLENRASSMPAEFSGGMQQRLAVARALATGSKLLLLDEPLSALDAKICGELRKELRRMAKELRLTAIHVTHDQEEAMELADKIVVMRNGEILQCGTPREIYESPASLFVAGFVGEANFLHLKFSKGEARLFGKRIKRKLEDGEYVAVLRPEHVYFRGRIPCAIVGTRALGPYYKYELEVEGMELSARRHELIKSARFIDFDPGKLLFFPEPARGLEKEIAVE